MSDTTLSHPAGAMDATYARAREKHAHLAFRFRMRAAVVARAVGKLCENKNPSILEIGAADGRTLLEISRLLAARRSSGEYVGVEYDAELMAHHPPLPANVRLMKGDARSLPSELQDASFDVVAMLALLEHLDDPVRALRESHRVLKPGGLLVATCPDPFWERMATRIGLLHDAHHVQQIDLPALVRFARTAGFEVVEHERFMWAPTALLPYLRIPLAPSLAGRVDAVVNVVPLMRRLCVNAYLAGRRPGAVRG